LNAEKASTHTKHTKTMGEVTFCHFDRLFDDPSLRHILVQIFTLVSPRDLDNCVRVCTAWRVFVGRHVVGARDVGERLRERKMPEEWLNKVTTFALYSSLEYQSQLMRQNPPPPIVSRVPIMKMLAPPLKIYSDERDAIMTTVDSMLVWDRRTKEFRGEIGPEIQGN